MLEARGAQGSPMRALRATPLVAVLATLVLSAAGGPGGPHPDHLLLAGHGSTLPAGPPGAPVQPSTSFTISGGATGLYPGRTSPLVLTMHNPRPAAIVVTSVTTTAHDASSTCPASNLTVAAFSGQLLVPAGGSAQTSVPVSMALSAPDACIGAAFPLSYSGTATEPRR